MQNKQQPKKEPEKKMVSRCTVTVRKCKIRHTLLCKRFMGFPINYCFTYLSVSARHCRENNNNNNTNNNNFHKTRLPVIMV